jgi:AraC family transcriptional regulator, transcriptional activator of the genes for pyochelin and ferripyochelin receptors
MSAVRNTFATIEWVPVSSEMTTLIGTGALGDAPIPVDAALLVFSLGGVAEPATLRIAADVAGHDLAEPEEGARSVSCVVQRAALDRLFNWDPAEADGDRYHLGSEIRAIALAIIDAPMTGALRETYRIGKSIELLCQAMRALASDTLVPVASDNTLSHADSCRLVAARRIIDEQWADKLTLDSLARACGLNRAKLTRGFRALYRCTIAEAIAERRLVEASRALLTTDLPVSSIGYASGYLNNASFSRAFGRRFGVSPSEYRGCATAA